MNTLLLMFNIHTVCRDNRCFEHVKVVLTLAVLDAYQYDNDYELNTRLFKKLFKKCADLQKVTVAHNREKGETGSRFVYDGRHDTGKQHQRIG